MKNNLILFFLGIGLSGFAIAPVRCEGPFFYCIQMRQFDIVSNLNAIHWNKNPSYTSHKDVPVFDMLIASVGLLKQENPLLI